MADQDGKLSDFASIPMAENGFPHPPEFSVILSSKIITPTDFLGPYTTFIRILFEAGINIYKTVTKTRSCSYRFQC